MGTLCNRRYTEKTLAYSESHDQSIVGVASSSSLHHQFSTGHVVCSLVLMMWFGAGDKTVAMWLMNAELYDGMSTFEEASDLVVRGMALHKMIHAVTMCLGTSAKA